MAVTLAELARRFQGRVRGSSEMTVDAVAALASAGPRDIAYAVDQKHFPQLASTHAGAVIVTEEGATHFTGSALIVANPHLCFARAATLLHQRPVSESGAHPTAVVSLAAQVAPTACIGPHTVVEAGAVIGAEACIGAGCYVGAHASIGARTRLMARVFIGDACVVGEDCLFQPGAVIGGDGFGFAKDGDRWEKVPQLGRVVIGSRVEVGANTTIDRGALNDTVIGDGVKLDNQIQIAHNVHVGENTIMAAQVGIAGSTVIGQRCAFGGQAGAVGHLTIADDVHLTAGSLVTGSITQPGVYSASLKAEPVEKWRRNAARLRHLDEMARRLAKLENKQ